MKKYFAWALVVSMFLFVGCAAAGDGEWIDVGGLRIPPEWSTSLRDEEEGGPPGDMDIHGEGVSGPIHMFFGYGFAGSIESLLEASASWQAFVFDDSESGYMVEFPDSIIWVRESYSSVILYHDGDRSILTDNEDLILRVARTLAD